MSSTDPNLTGLEEVRRGWPVFLLVGALLVVLGAVALVWVNTAGAVAVVIWGWFLIIRGVVESVTSFWSRGRDYFLLHLLVGVLALALGGLIVTHPDQAT